MIEPVEIHRLLWDPTSSDFQPGGGSRAPTSHLLLLAFASHLKADELERGFAVLDGDPRVVSASRPSPEASFDQSDGEPGGPEPWILLDLSSADLVGDPRRPDGSVSQDSLNEWAASALSRGFRHVWLSDAPLGLMHAEAPLWPGFRNPDISDPLSTACLHADQVRARGALSVSVDASWLGPHETGAQVALTRLLEALVRRRDLTALNLYGLPGGQLPGYAVGLASSDKVRLTGSPGDVFWRPTQPDDRTLMSLDRARGRRVVVTILDLIEYANPAYAASPRRWATKRERLRRYLRQADIVTGISRDVLTHIALEVPGIEAQRLVLTPLGIDPPAEAPPAGRQPDELSSLHRPYLLVLGSDYRHKNRDFAIRVWQQVAKNHDVDLVLAGLNLGVERSTTHREETQLSRSDSESARRVHRIPHVDAEEKAWLLQNAAVLLYPSSAEGFGFLPHEAAAAGVPAVFTAFGPLAEHFAGAGSPRAWSVDQYADRVSELMSDTSERMRTVSLQAQAGQNLTWQSSAAHLMSAFRRALIMSPQPYGLWERSDGEVSILDPNERLPEADARDRARELSRAPLLDRVRRRIRHLLDPATMSRRRTRGRS